MTETIDDITIHYEEGGVTVTKELGKSILSRGAWTTVLFRYCDWDANKQCYSADKFALRRYQKRNGSYQLKSKFTISSQEQANKIIDALQQWMNPEEAT